MAFGDNAQTISTNDFPPVFEFKKKGDRIVGQVVSADYDVKSKFRDDNGVLILVDQEGVQHTVWLSTASLVETFCAEEPLNSLGRRLKRGDLLMLELSDLKPTDKGNDFKVFSYEVAESDPDWPADLLPDEGEQPAKAAKDVSF